MIISGTITNASAPSQPDNNGIVYQDVVIRGNNNYEYGGRIGSKSGGYAVNAPIQVTSEERMGNNGAYNYFKKYNPQYQQQGAPRQQQGSPQQQAPQQQRQAPPPYSYPDAKDIGIARQCCIKAAARLHQANTATEAIAAAQQFEDWVFGRTNIMQPQSNNREDYQGEPDPNDF